MNTPTIVLTEKTVMLDWDDFEEQEFDEEELRIRQEQKRREEEQRRIMYS